jgi:hypothetical protein
MALEAADLNDGAILQQTKQNRDMRGNVQFEIVLPMGKVLTSEFINPDNAREALKKWLEVVKEQAIAEAKEHRLAQQRKAQGPMDVERKPGDDQPLFRAGGARQEPMAQDAGFGEKAVAGMQAKEDIKRAANGQPLWTSDAIPQNPLEFARAQYKLHSDKVTELKPQLRAFEEGLAKWSVILESLEQLENSVHGN